MAVVAFGPREASPMIRPSLGNALGCVGNVFPYFCICFSAGVSLIKLTTKNIE